MAATSCAAMVVPDGAKVEAAGAPHLWPPDPMSSSLDVAAKVAAERAVRWKSGMGAAEASQRPTTMGGRCGVTPDMWISRRRSWARARRGVAAPGGAVG